MKSLTQVHNLKVRVIPSRNLKIGRLKPFQRYWQTSDMKYLFHLIVVLRWLGHVTIPHKVSLHWHVLHLRQLSSFIHIFLCRASQFSPGHKLIQGGSQCPSPPSHLLVPHHILERYRLLITNSIQSTIHKLVGNTQQGWFADKFVKNE